MGRPDFGLPVAPQVSHALHNDNADVVDGDVAEAVHDGLSVEPELALPLGCM